MIAKLVIPRIRGKPQIIRETKRLAIKESRQVAMSNKWRIRRSKARARLWLKSASQNPRSPNEIWDYV
jgi:hypothetical protein